MEKLYKNNHIYVKVHKSPLPWVKVFTVHPYKELSEVPGEIRQMLFEAIDVIEKAMLRTFQPIKINIASFGNYLPHVHFHVTARFEGDSHFPEPMWGKQQRTPGYSPGEQQLKCFYEDLKMFLERDEVA